MLEIAGPVKEYNDVLLLARGVVRDALATQADGFQFTDVFTVLQANLDEAMVAYEGGSQIKDAWQNQLRECVLLTAMFGVDTACDILKVDDLAGQSQFKETDELIAAVSGILSSVISRIPGGLGADDILPIAMENFQKLLVGVEGVEKIGTEMKADVRAFLHMTIAFAVNLAFDVREIILKPKAEATEAAEKPE